MTSLLRPDDFVVVALIQATADFFGLLPGLAGDADLRLARPLVLDEGRTSHAADDVIGTGVVGDDVLGHDDTNGDSPAARPQSEALMIPNGRPEGCALFDAGRLGSLYAGFLFHCYSRPKYAFEMSQNLGGAKLRPLRPGRPPA